jgi:hypothetical protein
MALGAAPLAMQGQILTQTMTVAAIGLAIGLRLGRLCLPGF